MATAGIPNRPVFRAQEVCEIAEVQPYVLRSWEAEFPNLGFSKSAGAPRIYRKRDVERVLRIKHLLLVDGLTLAGARKRLGDEPVETEDGEGPATDADVAALVNAETRDQLRDVRRGLQWILTVLAGQGVEPEDRLLLADSPRESSRRASASSASRAKPRSAKKSGKGRR
jgi:DNA-binding transcriptional MerR regulator